MTVLPFISLTKPSKLFFYVSFWFGWLVIASQFRPVSVCSVLLPRRYHSGGHSLKYSCLMYNFFSEASGKQLENQTKMEQNNVSLFKDSIITVERDPHDSHDPINHLVS